MSNTRTLLRGAAIAAITLILAFAALASADILDDWAKVQPPPPPELKPIQGPDKFRNGSKLEDKLKARGIKTAIICGHSFQGVGIGTGSALALRGYQVIIPIDCMASEEMYQEQYAAYHLGKAANGVAPRVTLTRTTMIRF